MASFKEIDDFFSKLTNEFFKNQVPNIIAETANEFFKQRFTTKEWDGEPWPETKVPVSRGTLMVRSGALVNSIKPASVTESQVIISAGSEKVQYAKAHNEGETIIIPITAKMRKFAWAKYYEESGKGVKKGKAGNTYQSIEVGEKVNPWKALALTKKDKLTIKMPRRRFMGPSEILNDTLFNAMRDAFNAL